LQYIKYIVVEFTPSTTLLPWNSFNRCRVHVYTVFAPYSTS
jgi:hypothetical protein